MNKDLILYHTVENRNNFEEIRINAPYRCERTDAWLGSGYYFWDSNIDNAHFWGNTSYKSRGYVITEMKLQDTSRIMDLFGDVSLRKDIWEYAKELRCQYEKLHGKTLKITLAFILEHIRKHTQGPFGGVRVEGTPLNGKNPKDLLPFNEQTKTKQRFDPFPKVQVCIWDEKLLERPLEVVYSIDRCYTSIG